MTTGSGKNRELRLLALLRRCSQHHTITQLSEAIGEPTLAGKLRHARKMHQLPDGQVLEAIAGQLDSVGRGLLIEALAWDAELPGYSAGESAPAARGITTALRELTPEKREALFVFLGLPIADAARYMSEGDIWTE